MLKPADLHAMTPQERTQLFERLAIQFYDTASNAPALARDFDVTRPTIFRWRREHNVPFAVLYTLDRWINGEGKALQIVADWHNLPAQLSEAAEKMREVSLALARIARFSSAKSD